MKNMILFSMLVFFVSLGHSQVEECLTEDDEFSAALAVDCADRDNYSPANPDYIPVKYVRLALHIFQKDDGSGNFTDDDIDLIYDMIDGINEVYADLDAVSPGTSAHIPDSRVQFVLDEANIFFWQDDADWDWSGVAWSTKTEALYQEYVVTNATMSDEVKNETLIYFGAEIQLVEVERYTVLVVKDGYIRIVLGTPIMEG